MPRSRVLPARRREREREREKDGVEERGERERERGLSHCQRGALAVEPSAA